MPVNPVRHLSVFSPRAFGSTEVGVIGCGAVGSRVGLLLGDLGVERIRLFDFDRVQEENIGNQAFYEGDVGAFKVDALARRIKEKSDVQATALPDRVDGTEPLGDVVFVLTDTMESRKRIWQTGLKYRPRVKWVIETRMGPESGMIYAFHPSRPGHVGEYEETLYRDEEAEESPCGAPVSVGPTAEVVAGLAVWQMIRWFAVEQGGDDILDNEIFFSLRSMITTARQF